MILVTFTVQSFYSAGITAWFYLNRSYIAQKLCVNKAKPEMKCKGNCVLKKKLKEAENKQEDQSPQQLKEWISVTTFIISSNSFHLYPAVQTPVHMQQTVPEYKSLFYFTIFHPPILS